jgi:NADPH:quinone reductase-like Zn-dependent oxidoreductase
MLSEGAYVEVLAATVNAPGAEPSVNRIELAGRSAATSLLTVLAAPLNPLDLLIASGDFHSARHEAPYVPGSECVGVVVESDRFEPGALVYAECHASPTSPGAFADHAIVCDDDILVLPEGLDPVRAAAIGNSGVAAFMPLLEIAALTEGDDVLVLGATGAVGQLAVQIAHARGAARVVGVGRDGAALEQLKSLGANAVVQLRADDDVAALAARLADSGAANVVLDALYGMPFEAALQACAPRARIVNVGHSAGATATIPAGLLRGKQLALTGFAGLHTPLRDKQPALTWLWAALGAGTLRLDVKTVSLDELSTAWRSQAMSPHAKYVVVPVRPNESEK